MSTPNCDRQVHIYPWSIRVSVLAWKSCTDQTVQTEPIHIKTLWRMTIGSMWNEPWPEKVLEGGGLAGRSGGTGMSKFGAQMSRAWWIEMVYFGEKIKWEVWRVQRQRREMERWRANGLNVIQVSIPHNPPTLAPAALTFPLWLRVCVRAMPAFKLRNIYLLHSFN